MPTDVRYVRIGRKFVRSPSRPCTKTTGIGCRAVGSNSRSATNQRSGIDSAAVPIAATSRPIACQLMSGSPSTATGKARAVPERSCRRRRAWRRRRCEPQLTPESESRSAEFTPRDDGDGADVVAGGVLVVGAVDGLLHGAGRVVGTEQDAVLLRGGVGPVGVG